MLHGCKLKKVEELTLYIIDQDKTIKKQNDQYNELKQDMAELKALGRTSIGLDGSSTITSRLDISGEEGYNQLRLRKKYTPTSTSDTNGAEGDVSWDDNYIYIKTSSGWKRSALSTF